MVSSVHCLVVLIFLFEPAHLDLGHILILLLLVDELVADVSPLGLAWVINDLVFSLTVSILNFLDIPKQLHFNLGVGHVHIMFELLDWDEDRYQELETLLLLGGFLFLD